MAAPATETPTGVNQKIPVGKPTQQPGGRDWFSKISGIGRLLNRGKKQPTENATSSPPEPAVPAWLNTAPPPEQTDSGRQSETGEVAAAQEAAKSDTAEEANKRAIENAARHGSGDLPPPTPPEQAFKKIADISLENNAEELGGLSAGSEQPAQEAPQSEPTAAMPSTVDAEPADQTSGQSEDSEQTEQKQTAERSRKTSAERRQEGLARLAEYSSYMKMITDATPAELAEMRQSSDVTLKKYLERYDSLRARKERQGLDENSVNQFLANGLQRSYAKLEGNGIIIPQRTFVAGNIHVIRQAAPREQEEEPEEATYVEEPDAGENEAEFTKEANTLEQVENEFLASAQQELEAALADTTDTRSPEEKLEAFVKKYGTEVAGKIANNPNAIQAKIPVDALRVQIQKGYVEATVKMEFPEAVLQPMRDWQAKSVRHAYDQQHAAEKMGASGDFRLRDALAAIDAKRDAQITDWAKKGRTDLLTAYNFEEYVYRLGKENPAEANAMRNREAVRTYADISKDPIVKQVIGRIAREIYDTERLQSEKLTSEEKGDVAKNHYQKFVRDYRFKATRYLQGEPAQLVVTRLGQVSNRTLREEVQYQIAQAQVAVNNPTQAQAAAAAAGAANSAPATAAPSAGASFATPPPTPPATPANTPATPVAATATVKSPEQQRQEDLMQVLKNIYEQPTLGLKPEALKQQIKAAVEQFFDKKPTEAQQKAIQKTFQFIVEGESAANTAPTKSIDQYLAALVDIIHDPDQNVIKGNRILHASDTAQAILNYLKDPNTSNEERKYLEGAMYALQNVFRNRKKSLAEAIAEFLAIVAVSSVVSTTMKAVPTR